MAIGQGVLATSVLDVGAVNLIGARIEQRELDRAIRHGEQLRDALALNRVHAAAGMELSTPAYLALLMNCSETRATALLMDAEVLDRVGALDEASRGALSVEQCRVVADLLRPLDVDLAVSLWERLRERLAADRAAGMVTSPARVAELLKRWIYAADPDGVIARRKDAAELDADVALWSRQDGLVDLSARALSGADGRAVLDRLDALAEPTGPDDARTQGQRRIGALVDTVLGRIPLPFQGGDAQAGPSGCCPPGSVAPCGASIFVHVRLDTAMGESTVPAELVGDGPIDSEQLRACSTPRRCCTGSGSTATASRWRSTTAPGTPTGVTRSLPCTTSPVTGHPRCDIRGIPMTTRPTRTRCPMTRVATPIRTRHTDGRPTLGLASSPDRTSPTPAPTHRPSASSGCCVPGLRAASGRAAVGARPAPSPPAATSTTTWPGRPDRRAPAISARSAVAITASSSSAGPSAEPATARSAGPTPPAAPGSARTSTATSAATDPTTPRAARRARGIETPRSLHSAAGKG